MTTYDDYYCDSETLQKLRSINKRLFGDGRHLTPDERRDLANLMDVLLNNIEQLPVKEGPADPTTLYAQIEAIAAPIVKQYQADVTVHDKATLAALQPGDTVLWGCRESGSHIAGLDFADREMTALKRREWTIASRTLFRSANQHWPDTRWYLLTVLDHEGHGTVEEVSIEKVEQLYGERLGG